MQKADSKYCNKSSLSRYRSFIMQRLSAPNNRSPGLSGAFQRPSFDRSVKSRQHLKRQYNWKYLQATGHPTEITRTCATFSPVRPRTRARENFGPAEP